MSRCGCGPTCLSAEVGRPHCGSCGRHHPSTARRWRYLQLQPPYAQLACTAKKIEK